MNRRQISFILLAAGFILAALAFLIFLMLLVRQPLVYTQKSGSSDSTGSGSISRAIKDGKTAVVEGGIIRRFTGDRLTARATGLIIKIRLTSDKSGTVKVKVSNVKAGSIGIAVEGIALTRQPPNTVAFDVPLEPEQTKSVTLYPADNPYDYSFFVFGDSRGGPEILSRIISDMNKKAPLFGVDNGDMVTNGTLAEYTDFMDVGDESRVPFFTTVGNHDSRSSGLSHYESLLGPPYYSFSFGESHFVFLHTTEQGIDETQFTWLENDLKTNHLPKVFVFAHVPPLDPRPGKNHAFTDKGQTALFLDLMKRYRVTKVYVSHIHGYHTFEREGISYVVSGGAGAVLESPDSFYHYIEVKVNSDGVSEKLVKVPSSQVEKTVIEPIKQYGSEDIRAFWAAVALLVCAGGITIAGLSLFFADIRAETVKRVR